MNQKTIKVPSDLTRAATLTIEGDGENAAVRISISSDTPYLRYDWWNDEYYYEVLDHSAGGFTDDRLKAGLPMLFNHQRNSHLGRAAKGYECDGHKISVTNVTWSEAEDAKVKKADFDKGVLVDTSVGYSIIGEGECIGAKDGHPVYKFKWEPHEFSLVTIPADITVGAGREREKKPEGEPKEIFVRSEKEIDTGSGREQNGDAQPIDENRDESKSEHNMKRKGLKFLDPDKGETVPTATQVKEIENTAVTKERERVAGIQDIVAHMRDKGIGGNKIDVSEAAAQHIKEGKSVSDFQQFVMVNEFKAVPVKTGDEKTGASEKEINQFSLLKAIRDITRTGEVEGLEKELCDAAAKSMHRKIEKEGAFVIPAEVEARDAMRALQMRAQTTGSFVAGGATVQTMYGSMIELLRNETILGRLGITILDGLVGDILFPVQTGGATAYWVSETGALTDSEASFAQKAMTPKRIGATIPYSTQFLAQTSLSAEQFLRNELNIAIALKKDSAGLQGTGVGGEPLGVLYTPGINQTVTFGGAAAWADMVEFETGIAVDNAAIGAMKFALSATTVGKWKTILRDSVAGADYLIDRSKQINGYDYERSNQVLNNIAFFAVWAQLLHGMWAGREVIVDPYALKKSGQVEITQNELCDFLVRQPLAFNVSTDSAAQ